MVRVVLDTNVVVSAMLRSGGLPEAIFNLAIGGELQCYVSEPIIAEYEDVLRRPRLAINPDKATVALARIRTATSLVQPVVRVTAAHDPDDNIFLERGASRACPLSCNRQQPALSRTLGGNADSHPTAVHGRPRTRVRRIRLSCSRIPPPNCTSVNRRNMRISPSQTRRHEVSARLATASQILRTHTRTTGNQRGRTF